MRPFELGEQIHVFHRLVWGEREDSPGSPTVSPATIVEIYHQHLNILTIRLYGRRIGIYDWCIVLEQDVL